MITKAPSVTRAILLLNGRHHKDLILPEAMPVYREVIFSPMSTSLFMPHDLTYEATVDCKYQMREFHKFPHPVFGTWLYICEEEIDGVLIETPFRSEYSPQTDILTVYHAVRFDSELMWYRWSVSGHEICSSRNAVNNLIGLYRHHRERMLGFAGLPPSEVPQPSCSPYYDVYGNMRDDTDCSPEEWIKKVDEWMAENGLDEEGKPV